jgi:phospholipid N-methyltransferase
LEIALRDAEDFHRAITDLNEWLTQAEHVLNAAPSTSRLEQPLASQIYAHTLFQTEVASQKEVYLDCQTRGTKLQYYCQKKDAIPIKNLLVSTKHRFDKISSRTAERARQLDVALAETTTFHTAYAKLMTIIEECNEIIADEQQKNTSNQAVIRELRERHAELQKRVSDTRADYESTIILGRTCRDHAPVDEKDIIQKMLDEARAKWSSLSNKCVDRARTLEEALLMSGQFDEAVRALIAWLSSEAAPTLGDTQRVAGDVDTVHWLREQHRHMCEQLNARRANVHTVHTAADELRTTADEQTKASIDADLQRLDSQWQHVNEQMLKMTARLHDAQEEAQAFDKCAKEQLAWLADMETRLKFGGAVPDNKDELQAQIDKMTILREQIDDRRIVQDEAIAMGETIHEKCHPKADEPMRRWMATLRSRWDEVALWADQRHARLNEQLRAVGEQDERIEQLIIYTQTKSDELAKADEYEPQAIEEVAKWVANVM